MIVKSFSIISFYLARILFQNRVKKDWKGYTLPDGHVEPDESFVDDVIWETKEETYSFICSLLNLQYVLIYNTAARTVENISAAGCAHASPVSPRAAFRINRAGM